MNHKLTNIRWNVWVWILTIPLTAGLAALLIKLGMALSFFSL